MSAFAGIGKAGGFKLITGNSSCCNVAQAAMDGLGRSFDMANQSLVRKLEIFACMLYGREADTSINEVS